MNPLAVAAVWAGTGIAGAALLPPLRLRRLGVLVPLAGLAVVLTASLASAAVPGSTAPATLSLDRVSQGLVAAGAGSLVATLLLAPSVEAAQLRTIGLAAAGVVVALASGNAIVWAVALVGSLCVLSLRWIATTPGRATFTAGRVAVPGAAALVAAAAFLPVTGVLTGARPVLASGLLASGIAAIAGLLPLGGWAIGALTNVAAADSAVWVVLLAPAVLLSALRLEPVLPPLALVYFEGILTVLGLASALWQGMIAHRLSGRARYVRVLLADVALAATAIGTGHMAQALPALLLLAVTHMTTSPLLLQEPDVRPRARPLMWLLLCGLPPGPSFWGRFAVLEALSQSSFWGMVAAAVVMVLLFVAALVASLRRDDGRPAEPLRLRRLTDEGAAWTVFGGGLVAGLVPGAALTLIFGVR
ncbi:MAG: hypothetical protein JOZ75_01210 [Candidatus Dormibacteraeota bacterium]|nr:hypothetical protein [Candidatus Dormibacteraeota bacterium]